MTKIPPQSEPVDYHDLCKRLEVVARQQEVRNRSSGDLYSSKASNGSQRKNDSTSSAGTMDRTPPPPTAQATRPVSSMPAALTQSYKNRFSRMSTGGPPSSEQNKRFSVRSEIGAFRPLEVHEQRISKRMSAITHSQPAATSARYRMSDSFVQARDGNVTNSTKYQSERKSPSSAATLEAEGAPIVKRGSKRQVQVVNQSFRAAEHHDTQGMAAPVSHFSEEFTMPSLNAPSKHFSFDGTDACLSDISTATTEVAAHSTSSSRSDRKSWNQKSSAASKHLETDEAIAVPFLDRSLVSSVPPLHEITFANITSGEDAAIDASVAATTWDKPIPRPQPAPQPQAATFEPFRFHDYTFSHGSDMSSHRASDAHTFFFSDLDSGVGLSDSGSAAGVDEMPTLMNGAERKPDWNKSDPNLAAKRDSQFGLPQTVCDSPARRPKRESLLRKEVSAHEAFEFHPDLALEEEPPEDEGIVVNFESEELAPLPFEAEQKVQGASNGAVEDKFSNADKVKRRTFDPRQLFSAPKLFSQRRSSILGLNSKSNRLTFAGGLDIRPASSTKSTRPPSRSQPIVIMPHHQIIPDKRQSILASSSLPMQSLPSLPTSNSQAISTPSAPSRPRTATHIPIIPKIPPVPAFEIAHMTPQSLALLREQEKVIARRSTLSGSPTDREVYRQANPNIDMIGVALSSDATFVRPPVPPIPDSVPVPRMSLHAKPSVEFLKNKKASDESSDGTSSMSFSKPGRVRRLPPAAKSMLELHNVDVNKTSHHVSDRLRNIDGQGKKKWWKVWHRS